MDAPRDARKLSTESVEPTADATPPTLWCKEHQTTIRRGDPAHRTCVVTTVHPKAIRRGSVSLAETGKAPETKRILTGLEGFDRVLGGGLVPRSTILLSGDPGCGKSSLMALLIKACAERGATVLYASGEESVEQVRLRTSAVGEHKNIHVMHSNSLEDVEREIAELRPHLVIYDSIQRFATLHATGSAGSVTQVRGVAQRILHVAKKGPVGPISLAIGHIIKDGSAAGPKDVEHDFDTILRFSLDGLLRLLTSGKNRFGASGEQAIYEFVGTNVLREVRREEARPDAWAGGVGRVAFPTITGQRGTALALEAYVARRTKGEEGASRTLSVKGLPTDRVRDALELLREHTEALDDARTIRVKMRRPADGGPADAALDAALCVVLLSAAEHRALPAGLAVFGELSPTARLETDPGVERRVYACQQHGLRTILGPPGGLNLPNLNYHALPDLDALVEWVHAHAPSVTSTLASSLHRRAPDDAGGTPEARDAEEASSPL